MTGFSEAILTLGLFDGWDFDDLVDHYGAIVQTQIGCVPKAAVAAQIPLIADG